MGKVRAAITLVVLVPAFSSLPVITPSFASAEPVEPTVQSIDLAGVHAEAADGPDGAASSEAVVEAVESTGSDTTATPPAIAAASEPLVLTAERETDPFETLGVTWEHSEQDLDVAVVVRSRSDSVWTDWEPLEILDTPETPEGDLAGVRDGTEPMWVGESDAVQVRVDVLSGAEPKDLRVDLIDPGESAYDGQVGVEPAGTADAAASKPTIYSRAQWGADESKRGAPSYMSTIKAGTLHHTAGRNGYSMSDVPGIIRADYAYHVGTRGWSDLGYNFVVDRFGRIWEGRAGGIDRPVQGAHAGSFNTDTFGVSVLGDYTKTSTTSSSTLVSSLGRLFAWKLGLHYRDPAGKVTLTAGTRTGTSKFPTGAKVTLPVIFGHRDVGSTSCPGSLYGHLGTIRSKARAFTGVAPSNPAVTWSSTSVRVTAGLVNYSRWRVSLVRDQTGERLASRQGTGAPVDATLALRNAGGPLPTGDYHVVLDTWSGATSGRPWVSPSRAVAGSGEIGGARLGDGSLVVARSTAAGVEVRTAPRGGQLGAAVSLGGELIGAPSVAVAGDGTPVVLVRGANDYLYLKRRQSNGSWPSTWDRGPAGLGGRPEGLPSGSGSGLDVFVPSAKGTLMWFTRSASGGWSTRSVGGAVAAGTGVGAARTDDGALHVVVQGTDRQGWYSRYAGGRWSSRWTSLGGALRDDVGLAKASAGTVVAVAQGTNDIPYSMRFGSSPGSWERVSGSPAPVGPAVAEPGGGVGATVLVADSAGKVTASVLGSGEIGGARLGDGSLVVARATAAGVEVRTAPRGGQLGGAVSLGGELIGAPSVALAGDGTPVVLVRGTNDYLYMKRRQSNGSWPSTWDRGPAGLGGRPEALPSGSGAGVDVFVPSTSGKVMWFTRSSTGAWTTRTVGGAVAAGTGVGATRTDDGALHLVVQGTDRQGWYSRFAGGKWSSRWTALGGGLRDDVGLAKASSSTVVAVAQGTNDVPYSMEFGALPGDWGRVMWGVTALTPAVAEPRGGVSATVLVVDTANGVDTAGWGSAGWSGWKSVG